jgi:hypothetical protein
VLLREAEHIAAGSTGGRSDGENSQTPKPGPKHRLANPKRAESSIDGAFIYGSKPTSTRKAVKKKKISLALRKGFHLTEGQADWVK